MTARISQVLMNLAARVRAPIERDDPRVVDHFVRARHVTRRLKDHVAIAINNRKDRAEDASRDATIVETPIVPRVWRATSRAGDYRCAPLAFRSERRNSSIGRLHDERR